MQFFYTIIPSTFQAKNKAEKGKNLALHFFTEQKMLVAM